MGVPRSLGTARPQTETELLELDAQRGERGAA